jgi:CRISPR type III-A-associated RAMP protein Csm4
MPSGLLVRLRPTSPWRIGPDSGDRDRVDRIYHSDSLFSAVTSAMARLGMMEEWLDETARASEPAVRFSSCFPFQGETLFVVPPRNFWPPPASAKVRWKGARFVPLSVVGALVSGQSIGEDQWVIDGASECLVPSATQASSGPFRSSVRSNAAVDREGGSVTAHSTACLEFTPASGLWFVASFSGDTARERWYQRLHAALRLLADSGFGGERSRGWGRAEMPELTGGALPDLLLKPSNGAAETAHWMLSLFHPAQDDAIDWERGSYALATRSGRVESDARWGDAKKTTRMIAEGSVIVSPVAPRGAAADVAPQDFPHPVYRAGFALSILVPLSIPGRPAA